MTLVITAARFRAITGSGAYDAGLVDQALEDAQDLLVDALGRQIVEAQYTERLEPTRDGWLWPTVVPIVSAPGWTIDGYGLRGPFGPGWPDETGRIEVVYTGGWVERTANPTAPNRLPAYIERDLAYAALAILQTTPDAEGRDQLLPSFPAGATSISLGDLSVSFGPDGPPSPSADQITWSRRTLAWASKTVRGAGAPEIYSGPWRT